MHCPETNTGYSAECKRLAGWRKLSINCLAKANRVGSKQLALGNWQKRRQTRKPQRTQRNTEECKRLSQTMGSPNKLNFLCDLAGAPQLGPIAWEAFANSLAKTKTNPKPQRTQRNTEESKRLSSIAKWSRKSSAKSSARLIFSLILQQCCTQAGLYARNKPSRRHRHTRLV
jgi:hypothetical protein